jgi:hypothetical protein
MSCNEDKLHETLPSVTSPVHATGIQLQGNTFILLCNTTVYITHTAQHAIPLKWLPIVFVHLIQSQHNIVTFTA